MNQQPTHCLDVYVGYDESYRNELIAFLMATGSTYGVTRAQRGRMDGVKSLRVLTPFAEELQQHIVAGIRTGDDNDYEVHYSAIDAQRCMRFMPDYNNPLGDEEFDLIESSASATA